MNDQKKGKFIVLEGGEGSGKSVMKELARELFSDLYTTREPGGSPFAEKIREVILSKDASLADAKTQFALFWAARADHMKTVIIPMLQSGKNVLSDRFDGSSFSYQIFGQENRELEKLFWIMREEYLGAFTPDIYIYMDVSPKIGIGRRMAKKNRGEISSNVNHFDEREMSFHERISDGYKVFFDKIQSISNTKVIKIDASQELNAVKEQFASRLREVIE